MNGLQLTDVYKSFGETCALCGVSFQVAPGETLALLGPSGCGKSTTLALIAGLERPDSGKLSWNGADLEGIPPHERGFGLMFQDYALFPHMDVFDNVAFGLRMTNLPEVKIRARVWEVLELVGLSGFDHRDTNTLSGGEAQRVGLARSIAPNPRLLMLDEPLGSLDRTLRERLVLEIREILLRSKQTAIYVTHDQEEAFAIAQRVVLMNAGRIEQVGTPQEIYLQPASTFVARFLGLGNLLVGEIKTMGERRMVETAIGQFPVSNEFEGEVTVLLRPDAVNFHGEGSCQLEGRVVQRSFRGKICQVLVTANGVQMTFDFLSSTEIPDEGQDVRISFDPQDAIQVLK